MKSLMFLVLFDQNLVCEVTFVVETWKR